MGLVLPPTPKFKTPEERAEYRAMLVRWLGYDPAIKPALSLWRQFLRHFGPWQRKEPDTREICPVGGERYDKVHSHGFGGVRILPMPAGPRPVPPVPPPPVSR